MSVTSPTAPERGVDEMALAGWAGGWVRQTTIPEPQIGPGLNVSRNAIGRCPLAFRDIDRCGEYGLGFYPRPITSLDENMPRIYLWRNARDPAQDPVGPFVPLSASLGAGLPIRS